MFLKNWIKLDAMPETYGIVKYRDLAPSFSFSLTSVERTFNFEKSYF